MPIPINVFSTSVVNGIIYIIGGFPSRSTIAVYDPMTDTWTRKPDMPTGRGDLSTGVVNGKIYAIGGGTESANTATPLEEGVVEEYNWLLATRQQPQSVDAKGKLATLWGGLK